ncbi:peroxisomal membrane protein PEX14-like isoform X2 [Pomacea canaliculata]|uniref:peroxisomal membrane protein PEX14-like isoform X2 n=1 Tax=Pomacea canaliculata TaxID=400727 RepID=UPI000D7384FA|nr:peroxisomal membrane protein PEX14-like isoform X2 [Pomacea canaliculata]
MMAEEGTKAVKNGDLPKDVLAPAEGPREHLVDTAVKFLQNPKVRQSPLYQKEAFLEKKGLTKEEIQLAVQRAGIYNNNLSDAQQQIQHPSAYSSTTALVPVPQPLPPSPPTSWSRTREVILTSALIAAVSYAIYNAFKFYIRPWFMGKSETESRLEKLESKIASLQATIAESNSQMVETLKGIQATLLNRDGDQQPAGVFGHRDNQALGEVKAEITSLKGLLLSRRQFPPTPVTSPVIPSWQLLPREGKMDEITALKKEASDDQEMPRDAADENLSQEPSIAEESQVQSLYVASKSQKSGDIDDIPTTQEPDFSFSQTNQLDSDAHSSPPTDNHSPSSHSSCDTNGFEMIKQNTASMPVI